MTRGRVSECGRWISPFIRPPCLGLAKFQVFAEGTKIRAEMPCLVLNPTSQWADADAVDLPET